MNTPIRRHDTPIPIAVGTIQGIRHYHGRCGPRVRCYRPDCRIKFDPFATVELLDHVVLFFCHRAIVPITDTITMTMLDVAA